MHTPSDWIIATHVHAHASTPGPCATRARMTETLYKDRDATQTGGVKSNDGDHLAGTAKAELTKERKCKGKNDKKATQSAGFEPARGDPNRFQVCRLNHSATIADDKEVNQVDRIQVPLVHREGESPDIEAREGRPSPVHSCVHSHVFSHPVRNPGRNCHVLRCRLCRRRHAVSAAGSPHRCAGARAYVTVASSASNDAIACVHACCRPHAACMRTEAPREVAADQVGLPFSSWQQCSPNSSSTISSKCRSSASLHQRSKTSNIIRCCDECARVLQRRKSSTEVNRSWE